MCANNSLDKSLQELWHWGKSDLDGLVDHTFEIQSRLRHLQDAAAQNSRNSSRPPSTDRGERPKPQSLRGKSGRKPGAQPHHPGRTLPFTNDPDHIKIHPLDNCERCGEDLRHQPVIDYAARQVYDLPSLKLECTENRAEIKDCPGCDCIVTAPFPADVKAPVQYGKNFRALLAYLYEALEPFEERLVQILPEQPVLNADETSLPINQLTHWLHVLCTPLLTFFSVQLARGKEAIEAIGIIPRFAGWLMHDFLSSYLSLANCLHTFCKGHLLRELVFLFEEHQQKWAKDLHDLFLEMWRATKARKARDAPWREAEVDQWHERYWKILRAGRRANPLTAEQKVKKRCKQSKEQNLLDRLESYDQCILAFLADLELPFTNNEAERPLRMMKVRVKVSGCFRTLIGARRHARIRSYISTVRKHALPVLEQLRRALDGHPFLPEASKTT